MIGVDACRDLWMCSQTIPCSGHTTGPMDIIHDYHGSFIAVGQQFFKIIQRCPAIMVTVNKNQIVYSYYVEKKEERLEIEQTTQEKAQQLYKKELQWMRRQPKARTTKSKSRIDDFYSIKEAAFNRRWKL